MKHISAAVRSEKQVKSLSNLGVNVILVDLSDEVAVNDAVLQHEIDVVVHTASSFDMSLVSPLITALGRRRKITGKEAYFVQSSVTTIYSVESGWPYGEVKDTDPIFEMEQQMGGSHPVRQTNLHVIKQAKEEGVTSFIILIPTVYGRGSGECRRLSVSIPAYIRTSIAHKIVYKFDQDGSPPGAHISDLAAFYAILVEKILQMEPIPSGEIGYYFAIAHTVPWWNVMQRIAESLHARGLVTSSQTQIWPSYKMAAEYLNFPLAHVRAMGASR
ncbi:hypothetical protein BKA67DRAFT_211262 [Truncatella angustata]|uniref:NAD-dependent epimerase/dehydratase domain-containing protein n=1 Tax=Truncatella angustata TaxID=152316 RepID=A0A9P9A2L0_9PEZI|nr:uncharacterized protein BKA67DRAFT_211262 [Truncatella angustata]KAH6658326.1 hypothetical protein BKA67DRAFT_211262 [Truncatella angustata]